MEVLIRAGLAQSGTTLNDHTITVDALRAADTAGVFEGVPCYVNHSVKGIMDAGRIRLGYWRRIRYDEDLELIVGHLHTSLWDPIFERMGFSWHARTQSVNVAGTTFITGLEKVHSVDLVVNPAQQRCRVLDVVVLDESPLKNNRVFVSLLSELPEVE